MIRRDPFQAIADPTRRAILESLANKPQNYQAIAEKFSVSRTAIAKHLRILIECELVSIEKKGREKICKTHPEKLGEVTDWILAYRSIWNQKLDALGKYLEQEKSINQKPFKKVKNEDRTLDY